jgi:hypothetical protein
VNQTIELCVWIGIAGLALIVANLILWHARRVLDKTLLDTTIPQVRLLPSTVLVPSE